METQNKNNLKPQKHDLANHRPYFISVEKQEAKFSIHERSVEQRGSYRGRELGLVVFKDRKFSLDFLVHFASRQKNAQYFSLG